jgi:phage head maturation protease
VAPQTKALRSVEIKDASQGLIQAVFSTFDVIDRDGDVTRKSAFRNGAPVRISAFNHGSWEGALPVGKGTIRVTDGEAILDGQFFMNTTAGRDTFETVKQMGELQEFSYGFHVTDSEPGEVEGKSVRIIKGVDVAEVSPVLLGAGIGTRTLALKQQQAAELGSFDAKDHPLKDGSLMTADDEKSAVVPAVRRAIPAHETDTVTRSWNGSATVKALAEDARPSELRTVYAWVDPDGDPEAKSSYRFPHHHGVGGPANVKACLQGIATLNGASGDLGIPEADREAVHKHLSAHLLDADRDVPELRTAEAPKGRKRFADEAIEVLAAVSNFIDRASEVVALRARKNRGIAPATADLLSWLEGDLVRLKSLLETPVEADQPAQPSDDEIASIVAASLARINGI